MGRPISDQLTVSNDLSELARVSQWVEQSCQRAEVPAKTAFALDLCLAEAVNNIISYGYAKRGAHRIDLLFEHDGGDTHVRICDDAEPFNPLQQAEPPHPDDLEHAPIGGLGIHLIKSYTNAMSYEYRDGRNCLTLTLADEAKSA